MDLQYSSQFIIHSIKNHSNGELEHIVKNFYEILEIKEFSKKKLYVIFMLMYYFQDIREHILSVQTNQKWNHFINNVLDKQTLKHLNFKLNSLEYVNQCLDEFVIS